MFTNFIGVKRIKSHAFLAVSPNQNLIVAIKEDTELLGEQVSSKLMNAIEIEIVRICGYHICPLRMHGIPSHCRD